jgi:ATP-binding cassette, subfamily C (CFTR/MRP), member 1
MANSTLRAADDTFGPFVESISRTSFDFTRLFEESVFSIGPSALLLLVAPFRILHLSKAPRRVARSPLAIGKLVSTTSFGQSEDKLTEKLQLLLAIFTIIQAGNLALWTTPSAPRTRASIAAATLSFAAAVGLGCLSYLEHVHSIRPSPIINAYLLLTLPTDFAQVRTLWLRGSSSAVAAALSGASAVKVAVLVAEAVEKGGLLLSPFENHSPESTSGLYSRALFWWLNPLFLLGYKEVLSNDSLLAIDEELMSKPVYHRFQRHWAKCTT